MKINRIKSLFTKFLLMLGILIQTSCSDFFAPNISKKSVNVKFPTDQLKTNIATIEFSWEELKGADYYNLQIVKGAFSNITEFTLDSNITRTKFNISLNPGNYEWRIKAVNNSGSTQYTTLGLIIDVTLDLTNQIVSFISPANNIQTNLINQNFSWQSLYNAEEYRFLIYNLTDSSLVNDEVTTSNNYSTILTEGTYRYFVRAQNSISFSSYFSRKITIDTTPPTAPNITFPSNGGIISINDSLRWMSDNSSIGDSIYIYSDSTLVQYKKFYSTNRHLSLNDSIGTYFWRVKSIDAAGNSSTFSNILKFKLQ